MSSRNFTLTAAFLMFVTLAHAAEDSPTAVAKKIDALMESAWKERGIIPKSIVDDAGYLRRATLDITGRIPTAEDVVKFLSDPEKAKRSELVDRLLNSTQYAQHAADYWDALLMGRLTREAFLDRKGFRDWLVEAFAANRPWNEIATELVTAEGYNCHRRPKGSKSDPPDWDKRYHPATNWFLRYYRSLPDYSGAIAKNLMGVQIQCAQCHNHPTENWKQQDFEQFTSLFVKTWPTYYDKALTLGTLRLETKDRMVAPPQEGMAAQYFSSYAAYSDKSPKLLDGTEVGRFQPRRKTFAKWMTSAKNPWFARAFVNRSWQRMLGTGFVEPIDDFRDSNPATLPVVLDLLATDFSEHRFDVHRLIRIITATKAYQLECGQTSAKMGEHSLWSAFPIKPLDIESSYDIVLKATGADLYLERIAKGNSSLVRQSFVRQFVIEVGTDERTEASDGNATIPRTLMQWNGALSNGLSRCISGLMLPRILKQSDGAADRIQALYRCTLSRNATDAEVSQWQTFLAGRNRLAKSDGPATRLPRGMAGAKLSPEIANASGGKMEFRQLLEHARTGADFKKLGGMMQNNADAGLFVKSFEAWAAQAPFDYLANQEGGSTAEEQAYEDLFWALLSCTEFLTNH